MFTGTDATDLSDSEAAELKDIESYLATVTQMGACKESDIWKRIYADDAPENAYFCGSRPKKQVRFITDLDFREVRPCSEINGIHPRKMISATLGWRNYK